MWLSETDKGEVVWKTGLYPSPMAKKEDFAFLGSLIARAILDQRLVDLYLNEIFVDVLLDRNPAPSLRTLASIDPVLSQTLSSLKKAPLNAFADLYFTHPGSTQIELLPNGAQLRVTPDNYDEFLDSLLRLIIDTSLGELKRAFIDAFDKILPWEAFRILSSEEFNRLINGERGLQWDSQSILHTIRADHGYSQRSPQVLWLTEVFSELDSAHKTRLIQFLTGASQLPSGGWANLRPALTVVCRSSDDPDQSLPTVMTCANYLKLPRYSSKEILRDKLLVAIEEGGGSFLLS